MTNKISFFSLTILIIAAIDNIKNLPSTALFGSSLIFFFVASALFFLIPIALISAELSAAFPKGSGICEWVNSAFGKRWAMAAVWLQWINTMVWYPTILSFIAGSFAYVIDPELTSNRAYLVSFTTLLFLALTIVNLRGLNVSAMLNNLFCIVGTMVPLFTIIFLGVVWFFSDQPMQIEFSTSSILPSFENTSSWTSLIAIMASFLGMELAGVHVNNIVNPQKNFPKAMLIASLFIFGTMFAGALSIAIVLPKDEISLISGVIQLYSYMFSLFGLEALTPVLAFLIVVGATGSIINWLISPAKGLLHAGELGFLPAFLAKKNKHGVASTILWLQAVIICAISSIYLASDSINGIFWFLTSLSTELYMLMYILMFATGIKLHYSYKNREGSFKIPGGALGIWIVSLSGLIGAVTTIIVSFILPEQIDMASSSEYFVMIFFGNLVALSPLVAFYIYEKKNVSLKLHHLEN